jgi:hypothetical protein
VDAAVQTELILRNAAAHSDWITGLNAAVIETVVVLHSRKEMKIRQLFRRDDS